MQVRVSGGPFSKVMTFRELKNLVPGITPERWLEHNASLNMGREIRVTPPGTELHLDVVKV